MLHTENGLDSPARDKPPDELVWPLRLFLILLGYSTVAVPAALLICYVRRNKHAFETPYFSIRQVLRSFAVGNPEYQLIPTGEKQAARKEADPIPQTRAQCINAIFLLLFLFSGIQVTLVAMGVLQERIITRGYRKADQLEVEEKFGETQFLIFCNRIVALVLSFLILTKDWTKQPPHVPPLYVHSYTSFSNTISSWCQYEALKYVSFPTQTICKASKVVVTMLMGRIVRGQKYSWFEYGCGCTIAFGASLFLLSSSTKGAGSSITYTSFSGMILMAGYLLFDAFTLNWQKALFDTKPKVSKYQMMFGVNFFSAIFCAVSLIEQGTLWSSLRFGAEHVDFSRDVFLLSLSGAIGQIFIYSTIERFGPIVFAVIMTIRQMLSIVLSTIMYGHELTFWAAIGFLIVFLAIFVDIHKKYSDKKRVPQRSCMTIHKHLRQSHRIEHPFRAPEEEDDLAHIHMTLRFALIVFGMVPLTNFLIGLWIAAHPHHPNYDAHPNMTDYIRANYQWNETGNGQIWIPWKNDTKWNLGSWWNDLYIKNQSAYTFGINDHNFCNPRKEDPLGYKWTTSIYRSSQLFSSVQTALRYGMLFVFLPMVFNSFILAKTLVIENRTWSSVTIGSLYFCNEVVLYIAYFSVLTLHVTMEQEFIPYSSVYFSIAMLLSIAKLLLRNFTEPIGLSTIVRSFGLLILVIALNPLTSSVQDFIDHVYCDTFVSPTICILELACILVLFFNNLYDVHQARFVHLVVSQTIDDVNIQKMAEKSVFRRVKPST